MDLSDKEYENTCVNIIKKQFGSLSPSTGASDVLPILKYPSTSTPASSNAYVSSRHSGSATRRTQSIQQSLGKPLNVSSEFSGLRAELERKTEVADLRSRVKVLEARCLTAENHLKMEKAKLEHAEESHHHVLLSQKQKMDSLERKNQQLISDLEKTKDDVAMCRREAKDARERLASLEAEYRDRKSSLEKESEEYKMSLYDAVVGLRTNLSKASDQIQELRDRLAQSQERCAALEKQNSDMRSYCEEKFAVEESLKKSENESLELKLEVSRLNNQLQLTSAYTDEIAALPRMREENQRLQQQNQTFMRGLQDKRVLEEKIISLESALETAKERIEVIPNLYDTIEQLREYVRKWQNALAEALNLGREIQIEDFSIFIQKIREKELDYVCKISKLNDRLGEYESEVYLSKHRLLSFESQSAKPRMGEEEIRKMNKKLNLVTKERDMYKNVLDGYETDMTVRLDSQFTRRITELEEILAEYRSMSSGQALSSEVKAAAVSSEEVTQLKQKIAELEEIVKEKTKDDGLRILKPKEGLIEMVRKARAEKIAAIEEENEALKARIKLMEEGHRDDITEIVGHKVKIASSREIEALKSQLESANRMQDRLKEAFRSSSQQFRETCKQVFGFKIDAIPPNKYYMRSIYSDSENDRLLFMIDDQGDVQFLETTFSQTLGHLFDTYLQNNPSLPMFMSAVTMDLFGHQSMSEEVTISED